MQEKVENQTKASLSLFQAGWVYFTAAIGMIVLPFLLLPVQYLPGGDYLTQLLIYGLAIALPVFLFAYLGVKAPLRQTLQFGGIRIGELLLVAGMAVVGYAVVIFFNFLWSLLLDAIGYPAMPEVMPQVSGGWDLAVNLGMVALLPGILEELLMRGGIMPAFRVWGKWPAILITAVLFGLLHMNLRALLYATILGGIMGYVTYRTGSVMAGMVYHFFNNAIGVLLSAAADGLQAAAGGAVQQAQTLLELPVDELLASGLAIGQMAMAATGIFIVLLYNFNRITAQKAALAQAQPRPEKPRGWTWMIPFILAVVACILVMLLSLIGG
ncbi:CAAX amino terminal protease self-immunity [uncultured Clostridium sp.]|nr:CAAX amino terminal protease self-immunity [uncultured Clostridium sp.]